MNKIISMHEGFFICQIKMFAFTKKGKKLIVIYNYKFIVLESSVLGTRKIVTLEK